MVRVSAGTFPSLSQLARGPLDALAAPLEPPPRFSSADFAGYRPGHPTQQAALTRLADLAAELNAAATVRPAPRLFRWRRRPAPEPHGLYLDGGFGVGKTHLLAAVHHATPDCPRAYLSFQELVHRVGARGLKQTAEDLRGLKLLCLDEFELDDPGNTLIIKRVLETLFAGGTSVVTTSNTPASAQGEGRFNAEDFQREIQNMAGQFRAVPLDGPDFRAAGRPERGLGLPARLPDAPAAARKPVVTCSWAELTHVLGELHPIRYRPLLQQVGTLRIAGAGVLPTQNDALRFVHFIDRLYDVETDLQMSGTGPVLAGLENLFAPSYRSSAYRKKHDRCLSRLGELLSAQLRPEADAVLS